MFGQVLRKARENAGLTQEKLSFEAGLDRTYISHLENDGSSGKCVLRRNSSRVLEIRRYGFLRHDSDVQW